MVLDLEIETPRDQPPEERAVGVIMRGLGLMGSPTLTLKGLDRAQMARSYLLIGGFQAVLNDVVDLGDQHE